MSNRLGYIYGASAYLWWGTFPLFFMLLAAIDPLEIVPWRVFTAVVFCLILVAIKNSWADLLVIAKSRKMMGWFTLSSALLYVNWMFFVIGVVTGHIIETAMGYFINPIITILIGVVVRKEKLSTLQWVSVLIATVGVTVSAIAYGQFPFIALGVALSFGLYGAVRKQGTEHVDVLTGLTIETIIGMVFASVQLGLVFFWFGEFSAFSFGPAVTIPLLLSGAMTAVPLLLFAAGTKRLPLTHMGFIQFATPVLNFFTGYYIFNEPMTPARWIGFIAVWVALIVLLSDIVRRMRKQRISKALP